MLHWTPAKNFLSADSSEFHYNLTPTGARLQRHAKYLPSASSSSNETVNPDSNHACHVLVAYVIHGCVACWKICVAVWSWKILITPLASIMNL
jgi:hypothetical protein